ncbi:MAG: hypothetical protein LUH58_04670 [Lachnospiraceae bacterium]|nr:hypothetical protein [Lachnospiraceae bacterium]
MTSEKNEYRPIRDGFEITNGRAEYTRPLYSAHTEDPSPDRYLYFVGDKPNILLSKTAYFIKRKYAHLFLGIQNGKWFSEAENIKAAYVAGRAEYEIRDSSFEGVVRLTMTRTDLFDGLIIVARLPEQFRGSLKIGAVGSGGAEGMDYDEKDCHGTTVKVGDNSFSIFAPDCPVISGISNVRFTYEVDEDLPKVRGFSENNASVVYYLLTTESLGSEAVSGFLKDPGHAVESGRAYYERLLKRVKVETPDPYLDSAVSAQIIAMDAAWSGKTIMHGTHRWYVPHSGWRSSYGETVAGFSDRVKKNAAQFFEGQDEFGRITDFPDGDSRYNMGEVMVDQLLYNWQWDGDLSFFENGGYDFIKKYLSFEDQVMKVPGTSLYENWLNAWNTDNKWCNGGMGTVASSYMCHANLMMADIAARLGKDADSREFAAKAESIRQDMKRLLWDPEQRVYGEYRDRFGKGMLHACPDLSSIYTPIDEGITDRQEGVELLQYAEERFPVLDGLWEGALFPYSSDWLPLVYSSDGLYPGEVLHTALAFFQTGQPQKGYSYLKGVLYSLFHGETEGTGILSSVVDSACENRGNTDFADVCSMFIRTVVEGLFGIRMNKPEGRVSLMPDLPRSWERASVETEALSYRFCRQKNTELWHIETADELTLCLSLLPSGKAVRSVRVNGMETPYTSGERMEFCTGPCRSTDIEIVYEEQLSAGQTRTQGEIRNSSDEKPFPQAVSMSKTGRLPGESEQIFICSGKKISENTEWKTVCLDEVVNQEISRLHERTYTISLQGKDGVLPRFYFVKDTTRGVTANGRSWWESGRGAVKELYTPSLDRLPEKGGIFLTDAGIPFLISNVEGRNAAFASLYSQFPETLTLRVNQRGRRIYFLLCVSTNHMQAYVDNAVLEVKTVDGIRRLALVNPLNIDDWLNYQTNAPYAMSGYIQSLGKKGHANILCMEMEKNEYIESISLTCAANEVLAGLLGITIAI